MLAAGGILTGTRQLSTRVLWKRFLYWFVLDELRDPFPLLDSSVISDTAGPRGKIFRVT